MPEDIKDQPSKSLSIPFQRRKQLERDIEHITEEMYRRNKELLDTNKTLSLLRTIDALVLESHTSLKMVCEHITQAITQVTDYPLVSLLTRSTHNQRELVLNGSSLGSNINQQLDPRLLFAKPLHLKLTHPWFSQFTRTALINLETTSSSESLASELSCSPQEIDKLRKALPIKSLYIMKLLARRQIVGVLAVGFLSPTTQLNETDTLMLVRLSESIGVALDNKLLFEENQHVLRQLKESNSKLLALDEAKDDFISMASHQLRTPLTSVKGYLSMVLEGDTGPISPQQKKLLSQAFSSSQRMVYIIADLLNVSRLRTGKFIIEAAPVNLATLITEEAEQVKEMANARSIKIKIKTPKTIEPLMLDETKMRQVIMNFIDNAIYYTPIDGNIEVSLLDLGPTIELRVKDNGLGVPRNEQKHLFTKFYRASNARKARPDGTGLGLYMAQKVIIAEGGAIIFESQEGQGSTFGFTFSKEKLKIPPKPAPLK